VLIRSSSLKPGKVLLHASALGLTPAQIKLNSSRPEISNN
jgi:hypothetical protein